MNTYQITEITFADSSHRHTEKWIVKARRAPTPNEIRVRLKISPQNQILVTLIDFPVWELPLPFADEWVPPPHLDDLIRKYLGKPPYDKPSNTLCKDAYFLRSLKEAYGPDIILRVIEELT